MHFVYTILYIIIMSIDVKKSVFEDSKHVGLNLVYSATETSYNIVLHRISLGIILSRKRITNVLIRLCWPVSLQFACNFSSHRVPIKYIHNVSVHFANCGYPHDHSQGMDVNVPKKDS